MSVVIATYNRTGSLALLLEQLARQTLAPDSFEVVVVDDGSAVPAAPALQRLELPYELVVLTQPNAGQATARHRGIVHARAELVVLLDDDMRVGEAFLAAHLALHPPGTRRVILGWLREQPGRRLPLYERMYERALGRLAERVRSGRDVVRGSDLYAANVSFRRADYLLAGGFDPELKLSEDAELGIRLEAAGAELVLSDTAWAVHESDHRSLKAWMRRSHAYGAADSRIALKHPGVRAADPWRFIARVNPVSRLLLLASVLAPSATRPLAWLAMWVSMAIARLGAERAALPGATFVYGLQYYAGLRAFAGSRRRALGGLRRYLNGCRAEELGPLLQAMKLVADVRADHEAIRRADQKYRAAPRPSRLAGDALQKVGFQMMVAYRVMRFWRGVGLTLLAKVTSRAMRHLYGADVHWDADLAPGVILVHGTGLVVSHAARVGPGCILFQHVTLGENIDPASREIGAPTLEADVHVGPGAVLLGPITIGRGSKVMATALVMESVPPQSLVEVRTASVRPRRRGPAPVRRQLVDGGAPATPNDLPPRA